MKIKSNLNLHSSKQQGAALLIMMTVLVLTLSSVILSAANRYSLTISREKKTIQALAQAKQALIDFALLSDKIVGSPGIGYLPCPDLNGDGLSDQPCGAAGTSVAGWLPWQTLGIKTLRDSDHVCLRYVVSGNYKISSTTPATPILKAPQTVGHFVIQDENNRIRAGVTPAEYALAVIFAPHTSVAGQTRSPGASTTTACGSNSPGAAVNRASNYLETLNNVNNASGTYSGPGTPGDIALPTTNPSVFITARQQANFNDVLTWVSPADFIKVYARMP